MPITVEQVRHIARLANLDYTEEELAALVPQFSQILEHIEDLGRVPTEGVPPTYHAVATSIDAEYSRPDAETPSLTQEEALMNAPQADLGQYLVPKVIK